MVTAKNPAQGFRDEASGFRNATEAFATSDYALAAQTSAKDAVTAQNAAQVFRNEASGFRDEAEAFATSNYALAATNSANAASSSASAASKSALDALTYRNDAFTAKNDAVTAKNAAVTAKNDAVTAKNSAVTAKNGAVNAESAARAYRNEAQIASASASSVTYQLVSDLRAELVNPIIDNAQAIRSLQASGTGTSGGDGTQLSSTDVAQIVVNQQAIDGLTDLIQPNGFFGTSNPYSNVDLSLSGYLMDLASAVGYANGINTIPANYSEFGRNLYSDIGNVSADVQRIDNVLGDLSVLREPTLTGQLLADFAKISQVFGALSDRVAQQEANKSYWITSREYNLDNHPNNNTSIRWVHNQESDPIAVLMYVRVFDPSFPQSQQYVLPYTNPRVQPRFVTGDGTRARYVRINSPGTGLFDVNFHIERFAITTRRYDAQEKYWFTYYFQGTVSGSAGVVNPQHVLHPSGLGKAATNVPGYSGLRYIELDLGQMTTLSRIEIIGPTGNEPGSTIDEFNPGLYVTLLDSNRNVTYQSDNNIMQTFLTVFEGLFHEQINEARTGTLNFASSNNIEVSFDNADVTSILNTSRDFGRPFFGANRRFFLRALFDPVPRHTNADGSSTGFIETFTPTIDYL